MEITVGLDVYYSVDDLCTEIDLQLGKQPVCQEYFITSNL